MADDYSSFDNALAGNTYDFSSGGYTNGDNLSTPSLADPAGRSDFNDFLDFINSTDYGYDPAQYQVGLEQVSSGNSGMSDGGLDAGSSGGGNFGTLAGSRLAGSSDTPQEKSIAGRVFEGLKQFGDWTEKHKVLSNMIASGVSGLANGDLRRAQTNYYRSRAAADTLNSETNARAQANKEQMQGSAAGVSLPQGLIDAPYSNLRTKNQWNPRSPNVIGA